MGTIGRARCALLGVVAGIGIALVQRPAHADVTCADGSAAPTAEGCAEEPSIFRQLDLALGLWLRRLPSSGTIGGSTPSGAPLDVRRSTLAPIDEAMIDFQMRFRASLVYFGLGFSAGWVRASAASGTYDDYGTTTPWATTGRGAGLTFTGMIGATLLRSHLADVRSEVAFGLDGFWMNLSTPSGCTDQDGNTVDCTLDHLGFLVEPRVAADFWIARWSTLTAWAGFDALPFAGVSLGAAFTIVLRGDDR